MRLTKGLETSSAVTVPYATGRPRNLQYHTDRGESLKSPLTCSQVTFRNHFAKISKMSRSSYPNIETAVGVGRTEHRITKQAEYVYTKRMQYTKRMPQHRTRK